MFLSTAIAGDPGGGGEGSFAAGFDLLVVGEEDGHGGQKDVGDVAPHFVYQDPEGRHDHLHFRLGQGDNLREERSKKLFSKLGGDCKRLIME